MKGKGSVAPFRVFGSPYTLPLHQHVTYLRLKQVPFKVYCTNFTTTFLYSIYYRARNCFCTLTPSGASRVQVWQLAETAEYDEDVEAVAKAARGEVAYTSAERTSSATNAHNAGTSDPPARTQRLLLSKETHPNLHLASWCVVVYACWWLAKTGAMYRYIRGESLDVLEGYVRYFFIANGIGFARSMAPRFRSLMKRVVGSTGASELTAPFMDEHFTRFCAALEAHLRDHPSERFLLGTPHPTLADVTLGAVFSGFFLMDDPPSSMLAERFPCVTEYAERVTGWRGATFVDSTDESATSAADEADSGVGKDAAATAAASASGSGHPQDYPDVVPESLAPCFALMAEVFPFLLSQCAAFTAFMAGDGVRTLKREPLEGEWKGCEAYLLPQLTTIKSLMIVDDNVSTVLTRSQDLEVAFLAAREVLDDTLRDFGRHDGGAESPITPTPTLSTPRSLAEKRKLALAEVERVRTSPATAAAAAESAEAAGREVAVAAGDAAVPAAVQEDAAVAASPAWKFDRPLDLDTLDPEDADFYRAFSSGGRRRLGGGATSLAGALPTASNASGLTDSSSGSGSSSAVVVRRDGGVMKRLATLRTMLAKMSCPQYTLATVFHGRRFYVAVIPEYEVAKVRKARREAAAAAAAEKAKQQAASAKEGSK